MWTTSTKDVADIVFAHEKDDSGRYPGRIKYYRLVREHENKAGYSPLIVVK